MISMRTTCSVKYLLTRYSGGWPSCSLKCTCLVDKNRTTVLFYNATSALSSLIRTLELVNPKTNRCMPTELHRVSEVDPRVSWFSRGQYFEGSPNSREDLKLIPDFHVLDEIIKIKLIFFYLVQTFFVCRFYDPYLFRSFRPIFSCLFQSADHARFSALHPGKPNHPCRLWSSPILLSRLYYSLFLTWDIPFMFREYTLRLKAREYD